MKSILLVCFTLSLALSACATTKRVPSSDGKSGAGGIVGNSGHSGGTNAEYWYQHTPLQSHYHFAIIEEDIPKMKEWIAAGFSADTRATPRHPTALQQAIQYGNLEIVKLLTENPDVSKRPNLRQKMKVCADKANALEFNLYEFVVYQDEVDDYSGNCDPEDFLRSRQKSDEKLYVREKDLQIFIALRQNENNPREFRKETAHMLAALKKSHYSRYPESANAQLLRLLEPTRP